MPKLLYVVLELEEWNNRGTCYFCSNKAVCQIRTRNEITEKIVANDKACESCREKLDNNELPKCERCGRLQTESDFDFASNKYICDCIRYNEDIDEKELPVLPVERRQTAFYERQINSLREELTATEEELEIEREEVTKFQEKSEEWSKRQKQELLDRIKELEAENKRLKDLTPQELLDEIKRLKEEVEQLKEQNKQVAQVEIKSSKRPFLLFGKKS